MARVLIPVNSRSYNFNGPSPTATVTMKSNNPFESRTTLVNKPRSGAMPGMGYLGADDAGATATGFDWGKLFGSATQAIVEGGVKIGTAAITNRLTPAQPSVMMQPNSATQVPIQTIYTQAAMAVPNTPKWLPYVLIGGGVLALGAILLMKKRK